LIVVHEILSLVLLVNMSGKISPVKKMFIKNNNLKLLFKSSYGMIKKSGTGELSYLLILSV